ncbi:MAG TPA: sigma-70 family RNA polymerase sigma factor [Methylomirabilota bacterium]|nr:sigma-70 family RNA polymerase sigma factor [Methylomirabilota bacterium]
MTHGAELIRGMANGDRNAFARFYDRYAPMAYRVVRGILREPADAAEVLQDVFWEARVGPASYDPQRGSPEAWIVMRARTRAIDQVRSVRKRTEVFGAPLGAAAAVTPAEPGGDVATRAAERVTMKTALDDLPEAQREIIELAYWNGLTHAEIAARLGQPLGTVKTRMRLGLERLKELLRSGH